MEASLAYARSYAIDEYLKSSDNTKKMAAQVIEHRAKEYIQNVGVMVPPEMLKYLRHLKHCSKLLDVTDDCDCGFDEAKRNWNI